MSVGRLCLAVAVTAAAVGLLHAESVTRSDNDDSFEVFTTLAQEQMQRFNATSHSNRTRELLPEQLTVLDVVMELMQSVIEEQKDDLSRSIARHSSLLGFADAFAESGGEIGRKISDVTDMLDDYRRRMQPTPELREARVALGNLKIAVHALHMEARESTGDVEKAISDVYGTLNDLKFIKSAVASGSHPDVVGRLVHKFGGKSQVHNIIERSLNGLIAVNDWPTETQHQPEPQELLQFGEGMMTSPGDFFTWVEDLATQGTGAIVGATNNAASTLTGWVFGNTNSAPASTAENNSNNNDNSGNNGNSNNNNNNNNNAEGTQAGTPPTTLAPAGSAGNPNQAEVSASLIQQGNAITQPEGLSPLVFLDDPTASNQPVTPTLVLHHVTLSALSEAAAQCVLDATGAATENTTLTPAVLKWVPTAVFGRNLTDTQLTAAVLRSVLTSLLVNDNVNVTSVTADETDGVSVTVSVPEHLFPSLGAAVGSGLLATSLRERMSTLASDVDVSVVVASTSSPAKPEQTTETLLSLDEGSPLEDEECRDQRTCELRQVGKIFTRLVDHADHSRNVLETRRERMMQPYAARLLDLQRNLTAAQERVEKLERQLPNTTAQMTILQQTLDRLMEVRLIAEAASSTSSAMAVQVMEQLHAHQDGLAAELILYDDVAASLHLAIPAPLVALREQAASQEMSEAETEQMRALLESQLRQKREGCASAIAALQRSIARLRRNIDVVESLSEVVLESSSPTAAAALVEVAVSGMDGRVHDAEQGLQALLQASGDSTPRERIAEALAKVKDSLKKLLDEETVSEKAMQAKCDKDIAHIKQQIQTLGH